MKLLITLYLRLCCPASTDQTRHNAYCLHVLTCSLIFLNSFSAGATVQQRTEPGDSKLFEKESWAALSRMNGMQLRDPQGGCIQYRRPRDGRQRACPDIVGSYAQKGFVADCKLYSADRAIDNEDVEKLHDDVVAVTPTLVREDFIPRRGSVTGIFITTTDRINIVPDTLRVIIIDYDGGLGDRWEAELQRKFRRIM